MREILFRGKRVYNRKWITGYYSYYETCHDHFIITDMSYGVPDIEQVYPETVGQYTGFTDKNGKRIFEGDIVRFYYVDDEGNDAHEDFLIFFEEGAFRAQYLENPKVAPNTLHDDIEIEDSYVIGNKWDNPELLEVKK